MSADYRHTATLYQWLERLVFGNKLQRARTAYLGKITSQLKDGDHILLIGDGDGRFLKELLEHAPSTSIDYVEPCAEMISQAQKRVASDPRVHWIQKTIEEWCAKSNLRHPDSHHYALVVSHFVFDSLEPNHLPALLKSVRSSMAPDGAWIVTDFDATTSRWGACVIAVMYGFFHIVAGVSHRKLAKFNSLFEEHDFHLADQKEWIYQLIYSQIWTAKKQVE